MNRHLRQKFTSTLLGLFTLFLLLLVSLSVDPCPFHEPWSRHHPDSSFASRGMMCFCLIYSPCPPSGSGVPYFGDGIQLIRVPFSERVIKLRAYEIFHPPRGLVLS